VDDIGDLLNQAAGAAEDLLLFYSAGHGLLGRGGELYLSLYNTPSLGEIYRQLYARLRADGLPLPQQRGTATADLLGLVRNHAANEATLSPLRARTEAALEKAVLFSADMNHDGTKARVLAGIADALAMLNSDGATRLFERAIGVAATVGESRKSWALAGVAKGLAAIDPARANALFEQAITFAATMDERWKPSALAGVAKALAAIDPARATDLLEQAIPIAATKTRMRFPASLRRWPCWTRPTPPAVSTRSNASPPPSATGTRRGSKPFASWQPSIPTEPNALPLP
jgi:hypothetical protein